jgi:hypothetical protein
MTHILIGLDIPIIASAILQFMSTKGNILGGINYKVLLLLFICLRLFNVYDRREGVERKAKDG